MSSDDQILLARAASGDGEALDALMSRYASRVYCLAYGITRSSGDAEEVVQDVFLQIVQKALSKYHEFRIFGHTGCPSHAPRHRKPLDEESPSPDGASCFSYSRVRGKMVL